jgi:hypothetical protein
MKIGALAIAAAVVAGATSVSNAGPMTLNITANTGASTEHLGNFTGSLTWNYTANASFGKFIVALTNTSAVAGGKITGFALSKPTVSGLSYALTSVTHPFTAFASAQNAAPFGTYDLGAGLNGTFTGGGSPNAGVKIGQTGTFEFTVSGLASTLATLDASSFFSGPNQYDMVVRYRGFEHDGSDKVPAQLVPQQDVQVVPVPAPLALAGLGLIGGAVLRRRMKP